LRDADPIAWLLACEEIRQLASRHAVHLSHRDLDGLVELYAPDIRVTRDTTGREALKASAVEQLLPGEADDHRTILQVTNHVIDVVDADHATDIVGTRGEIELGAEWVIQVIEYHDDYHRVDGRWLFVRRRHHLWYGADMLQRPNRLAAANWPASQTGKGVLPKLMPSWRAWVAEHSPLHR
jgi:hypothetical protein